MGGAPGSRAVRLQKILAAAGVSSRRRAEDLLRQGRVAVNGRTAVLGESADPDRDVIALDGVPVQRESAAYWILNKPRGVLTTVHDPHGRPTVLDLVPERRARLFPVGRLDRDTEGLVLLTNDGRVAHALLHPSHRVEREYRVTVSGRVAATTRARLAEGVILEDGVTAPARVGRPTWDPASGTSRFTLTVIEGRKRQIRRALEALGHPVVALLRVRMGPLRLGRLASGAARPLSAGERRSLQSLRTQPPSSRRAATASGRRVQPCAWDADNRAKPAGNRRSRARSDFRTQLEVIEFSMLSILLCERGRGPGRVIMLCCRVSCRFSTLLGFLLAGACVAAASGGAAGSARAGLIGICPDGSMFIVQRAQAIPCREAKLVEPDEVPPLRSQFLPRPYAWEVHKQRNDPNNPYNLIDAARQASTLRATESAEPVPRATEAAPQPSPPQTAPAPRPLPAVAAAPPIPVQLDLALSEQELRDLVLIVDLAQQRAPATIAAEGGAGPVLRLARSAAFESRLRDASAHAGRAVEGPVVLFMATASQPRPFHPNLTFVQGHRAFHPDPDDPNQLGVIRGRLGTIAPDEPLLGYAVLPEHLDLSNPVDIYWDDRRFTAKLTP